MTNSDKISTVKFTAQADLAFAKFAQGALFNRTIMPSGFVTPPRDMEIVGTELVPVDREEWLDRHHPKVSEE